MTRRRRRWFAPVLAALLIASAAVVWAYWTSPGAGTAAASTASLSAATISVPGSATNSVTVTWSGQASLQPSSSANSAITYVVQRRLGAGSYAAVASGGCSGALARGTSTCADVPPATGSYSYRVVASFNTWTATSGDSGSVSFLLDTTAPTTSSINRAASSPTNASSVDWTVTFSESVTGVGIADFALARAGGLSGGTITGVTGSGTTYTVSATSGSGSGTLGLNLTDDDSIVDVAANPLGGAGLVNGDATGQVYTLDRSGPARSSMSMLDTNANGKIDRVTVTFDETLASSTATAPWTLANVPSGGSLSSVSTSGAIATLDLSEGASSADTSVGTFTVALATSATGIRDALGNQSSFAATAPTDAAPPVRVSMSMLDADGNGKVDRVTAGFSETLASSTATAPWTLTATPSAGTLSSVSTATTVATLTIGEGAGATDTSVGSFTVALAVSASGIRDAAGNQSSFSATAPTDAAAPTAQSITRLDSDPTNSASVRWTVTFSESVTGVGIADFSLVHTGGVTGDSITTVGTGTTSYVVTASTGTGTGSGTLGLNVLDDDSIKDGVLLALVGAGTNNGGLTGPTYTVDRAAPTLSSLRMLDVDGDGRVDQVTATFNETIASTTNASQWTLANVPSGGTKGTVSTSGAVATINITEGGGAVSTVVGSFTVALTADATGIRDPAGNTTASFGATAPADGAAPALVSMSMLDNNTANGKVDKVTATFTETLVSTTLASQWTLANVPSAGTRGTVTTATTIATINVTEGAGTADTGVGSFTLALAADATGIRDAAGNTSSFAATAPSDGAAPRPLSVSDTDGGGGDGKLGVGDTMSVVFSEAMAGLQATTTVTESKGLSAVSLSVPGFTNGDLDMGSGAYVTVVLTSITYNATSALSPNDRTITITVGSCSGLCINLSAGNGTMTYVPATNLHDGAGNVVAGTKDFTGPLF